MITIVDTRLKLLSLSQLLLLTVRQEKWSEYPALNHTFQKVLSEAAAKFGANALDPIASQLQTDNQALIDLLEQKQKKLHFDQQKSLKDLDSVRSYLK